MNNVTWSSRLTPPERERLRRYLRRRGRTMRYKVPSRVRKLVYQSEVLLDSMDIPNQHRPKIIPVDTCQRISEAITLPGMSTVVLFDNGHIDALHWLLGLSKRGERGRYMWVELMIRSAEAALIAGNVDMGLRITGLAHKTLEKCAKHDGTYPELARPKMLNTQAYASMPIQEFLAGARLEEEGMQELIAAFVLGHEIGHHLEDEALSSKAMDVIHKYQGMVGVATRLMEPSVLYEFDAQGYCIREKTIGSNLSEVVPRRLNAMPAEWWADYMGLILATERADELGLDPDFVLFQFLVPLFIYLEMDAVMRRLISIQPRKGTGGELVFEPSLSGGRVSVLYAVLDALRKGEIWGSKRSKAFWHECDAELSLEAAYPIEHQLAFVQEIHRRALLEAILPLVPSYEEMIAHYPPELHKMLLQYRPLQVDPAIFSAETLEPVPNTSLFRSPLAAFGQAARDVASCLWDPDGIDSTSDNIYVDKGMLLEPDDQWKLVQTPGLDIMYQQVTYPPKLLEPAKLAEVPVS